MAISIPASGEKPGLKDICAQNKVSLYTQSPSVPELRGCVPVDACAPESLNADLNANLDARKRLQKSATMEEM